MSPSPPRALRHAQLPSRSPFCLVFSFASRFPQVEKEEAEELEREENEESDRDAPSEDPMEDSDVIDGDSQDGRSTA